MVKQGHVTLQSWCKVPNLLLSSCHYYINNKREGQIILSWGYKELHLHQQLNACSFKPKTEVTSGLRLTKSWCCKSIGVLLHSNVVTFVRLSAVCVAISCLHSLTCPLLLGLCDMCTVVRCVGCVCEGFTNASFSVYWSLDCGQTARPSASPFLKWRLLLEPFIWSSPWVHEQGRSDLH